jgi:hypothetical protein
MNYIGIINASEKVVEKNKTIILCSITPPNHAICERMWNITVELGMPWMRV